MAKHFDIDPQETIIRALNRLEAGWVRGILKGPSSGYHAGHGPSDGQDAYGVCIRGAFQESLTETFVEQLEARVLRPEHVSLQQYHAFIRVKAREFALRVEGVFNKILTARIKERNLGYTVEGFNDSVAKNKQQVVEFLRSILDEVMREVHSKEEEAATVLEAVHSAVTSGKTELQEVDDLVEREQAVLQSVRSILPQELPF